MAYLEVSSKETEDFLFQLDSPVLVVGRDPACAITLPDQRVSRKHFRFIFRDNAWHIEDLGSTNGISVNKVRVANVALKADDSISVGPFTLLFRDEITDREPSVILKGEELTQAMTGYDNVLHSPHVLENHRRFNLFLDIAEALESFGSTDALLSRFKKLLVELFEPNTLVLQFDRTNLLFNSNDAPIDPKVLRIVDTIISRVVNSREALVFDDMPNFLKGETLSRRASVLCAPIFSVNQKTRGAIYLDREERSGKPFTATDLRLLIAATRLVSSAILSSMRLSRLAAENQLLSDKQDSVGNLQGDSRATKELVRFIEEKIGPVNATVLLTGETGTGKSRVAECIHLASRRAEKRFVSVNCAAIPKELMESELFGHEKGAFSGASGRKKGFFEAADKGTVFLDEVGELDASLQAKLLNVLQEKKLTRIGSTDPISLDVRIIAATNRDLKKDVESGRFRADLFYRLNVVHLQVPPLRERAEDILPLANYFLQRHSKEMGKTLISFDKNVENVLRAYPWPGNVRELSNCIERAVIFSDDMDTIRLDDLPPEITTERVATKSAEIEGLDDKDLNERNAILDALRESNGNRRKAALILGWYPQKFYARLKRYDIG